MKFPLQLSFKKIALAPQISVTDADGHLRLYVRQKLFKLKEAVTVFADADQRETLYTIQADRVLDFGARYKIADRNGAELGSVKREGMRSFWKAHYSVERGGREVMTIREENPWVKVVDSLIGEIPVVGLLTGYMLHPAFAVTRADGSVVLRVVKQPALFEGKFVIEKHAELDAHDEGLAVLSILMMTLLERARG